MPAATIDIKPVYAIVGDNRFLVAEALERILASLGADQDGMGPVRFDGGEVAVADVLDEVRTPSLLGDRRVAIVDDAATLISASRDPVQRYCESPSDTGVLILLCKSLPRNTKVYKAIARTGVIVACEPPKGQAIVGWIVNRARTAYDKRLGQQAARSLREHTGDMLGALDAELSKLATYAGQRPEITIDDIDTLTGRHREEKVFAVTDAIAAKDPATAMKHWEQVLATDPAAPGRAVAGLAWGVRQLLTAKQDQAEGTSLRVMAGRMFTDEHVLRRRLERVTVADLEAQQRDLLAADLAVKTGKSTVNTAVEKFIVTHGSAPCARRR